ncbi:DUF1427 family protein [Streptomyces sp. NPDC006743]|uniref:DUF1427 family protein n=1 Tax=Streptomyces sp. NPDC006743 TaxID=3154480 RepID=UPI0034556DE7
MPYVKALPAGVLVGAAYTAVRVKSPAPPLLGLTGLSGIVLGERATCAARARLRARRATPAPASAAHRPPAAPEQDGTPWGPFPRNTRTASDEE